MRCWNEVNISLFKTYLKNYIDDGVSIFKLKNDYIFKWIFGDEKHSDILMSFLEYILKNRYRNTAFLIR